MSDRLVDSNVPPAISCWVAVLASRAILGLQFSGVAAEEI